MALAGVTLVVFVAVLIASAGGSGGGSVVWPGSGAMFSVALELSWVAPGVAGPCE